MDTAEFIDGDSPSASVPAELPVERPRCRWLLDKMEESWNSVSFDGMDVRLTRPGFGFIALIEPDQIVHRMRDNCEDVFLLKTRDKAMHVTVFQVFMRFDYEEYDPASLPNDLLSSFCRYMKEVLKDDLDQVNKKIACSHVRVTHNWFLLGSVYPSHLAMEVECKEANEMLWDFKQKANAAGREWMASMRDTLKLRGFKGDISESLVGTTLAGTGWELMIGFTANADYRTHVTLGIISTGDEECDRLMLRTHDNLGRTVDPNFSPDPGSSEQSDLSRALRDRLSSVQPRKLQKLSAAMVAPYPRLSRQVENAKAGRPVDMDAGAIREWGQLTIKCMEEKLAAAIPTHESRHLKLVGVDGGVINMSRIQNFEPVISADLAVGAKV